MHVALLGSGNWSRVHLGALTASPHVERVTLVGRRPERLAELADEFPIVVDRSADHREPLDDPTVELVQIALPHHLHAPRAAEALRAGKHVICEKPAALDLAQFDQIAAAARGSDRRLLVVLNQLYNPVAWRLRELIDEGVVGRPFLSVENAYSAAGGPYRDPANWRTTRAAAGGGVLIDGGYHMVYRHLYSLAGIDRPNWVLADTPQLAVDPDGREVADRGEDFVSITVGYGGPLRIAWSHGWTLAAPPERARQHFVAGSEATLELTDQRDRPLLLREPDGARPVDVPPGPWTGAETTHACLVDYLDCLATGREPERASLAIARLTLAVIAAAYEAGRSGARTPLG